ncbi:Hydroxymethylglutaryl-CoA synthase [Neolecta irregularis DAH-3]|uniref:Hydroxymethylglutaryl-CoA synthase n=1 Tax=Neolecta irregularis (strain DAH-3) TaxID=1198029 RepID=A0A1U7LSE7_NEOID|nr:Hydroxymethylglutaryl-CoA synthase [Neolecta irregularis DAH-3]|eukprot:OLL25441.1 Hydroxymethylglutaryl-CoA synthase [Neolecta irregularis DAH-3]
MSPLDRPEDVGIKAMEVYFPSFCVDQAELEKFDGVSAGKYTVGLGQKKMGFCDDREDIYSLALTTVSRLLEKNKIDPKSIGRLEVGTETLLDKSKSVKSVLMQLFAPSGNNDIEGVDNINACYGGTNAFFNALNWIESSSWDGRNAIVVAGDIALYAKGAARPTGGAGCVAMLVGPRAPIVVEAGLRGTYMAHAYDFYKPDPRTEYPYVDGQFSLQCYTKALDECYKSYYAKISKFSPETTDRLGIDRFDYNVFHSPTCKLVQKSYARMLYNDYLENPSSFPEVNLPEVTYEQSITSKEVEKTFMVLTKERFEQRVKAGLYAPQNIGNMYTATVYACLASLISATDSKELIGKRVGIYSYGSGLAASLFSALIKGDTSEMARNINLKARLDARVVVEPSIYDDILEQRHQAHLQKNFTPQGDVRRIDKGAYYLTKVDDMYRRSYEIKT